MIVLVVPAGIVAVLDAIVTVFLMVFALLVDAATAITLPRRIVSRTETVSVTLQEVLPVIAAPDVLMRVTLARPGVGAGIGVAMTGVDLPLLARWVLSPV